MALGYGLMLGSPRDLQDQVKETQSKTVGIAREGIRGDTLKP